MAASINPQPEHREAIRSGATARLSDRDRAARASISGEQWARNAAPPGSITNAIHAGRADENERRPDMHALAGGGCRWRASRSAALTEDADAPDADLCRLGNGLERDDPHVERVRIERIGKVQ